MPTLLLVRHLRPLMRLLSEAWWRRLPRLFPLLTLDIARREEMQPEGHRLRM